MISFVNVILSIHDNHGYPLSAVRTMWSLSLFSSLKAKFCALVKLGLGVGGSTLGLY